jgi:sensor c-di-GMP phosphodiesterase-like protein
MRYFRILLIILGGTTPGIVGGYVSGRLCSVRAARDQAGQDAGRVLEESEASGEELRTTLATVDASPYPACSDADIGVLRALLYDTEYAKDAGRMHEGKILCSANLGRAWRGFTAARPTFVQRDGSLLYRELAPYEGREPPAVTLGMGDAYVVFTPTTLLQAESAPLHFTETVIDAPTGRVGTLGGEALPAGGPEPLTDGHERRGAEIYAIRCSQRFLNCVTVFTSTAEVMGANRRFLLTNMDLGAVLGACIGLMALLFRDRNAGIDHQLRRAIRKGKVRVVYQPLVNLATRQVIGAEALARWTNEDGIDLSPALFIPVAEKHNFVQKITGYVLERAIRDFEETFRRNPDFRVSINVTARDLKDPGFPAEVNRVIEAHGLAPRNIALEITESATVANSSAIEAIRQLRQTGHSVHIDDFGTGYSSLSYLGELSADAIKIDRSFTQSIGTGTAVIAILPQILAMAEALHLQVIVEGVETPEQAAYFAAGDFSTLGQGWLFGRPVSASDFMRLLEPEASADAGSARELASTVGSKTVAVRHGPNPPQGCGDP